jgi:hypothetical protein
VRPPPQLVPVPRCRRPWPAIVLLVAGCTGAAGCAGATTREGASGTSRDVITAEALADYQNRTVLDALRRMRPNWLRSRVPSGGGGAMPVLVFVDGVRRGSVPLLSTYQCSNVADIRYIPGPRAMMVYGDIAYSGAILIRTKTGG